MATNPKGLLLLLLHAHLPYVRHPEGQQEVEERWLFEAITECYLPLVDLILRLCQEGLVPRLSLSLSPTLVAMFRDPVLLSRYETHLHRLQKLVTAEGRRICSGSNSQLMRVHSLYQERLERTQQLWQALDGDLVGAFATLEASGAIELLTTCATHAFLPLLRPRSFARAQIGLALESHELLFGRRPRGFWLPECGYEPGLEEQLLQEGVEYFFLESHGIADADPTPQFGVHAPLSFGDGKMACYGRDPECSRLVWSATEGYPADPVYREFYRDIVSERSSDELGELAGPDGAWLPTGLKYYRITGATEEKALYDPRIAAARAMAHAADFVRRRGSAAAELAQRMDRPPVFVALYDAELFGHWWFEGPIFLEEVLRKVGRGDEGLALVTASDDRRDYPRAQLAHPAASSWGDGGYNQYWLRDNTAAMYRRLTALGHRVENLLGRVAPEALGLHRRGANALIREILLAQASDWPFLIQSGTANEYAEQRLQIHLDRAESLVNQLESNVIDEGSLRELERAVPLFSGVDAYSSVYC